MNSLELAYHDSYIIYRGIKESHADTRYSFKENMEGSHGSYSVPVYNYIVTTPPTSNPDTELRRQPHPTIQPRDSDTFPREP